jgi:hypothetical protein
MNAMMAQFTLNAAFSLTNWRIDVDSTRDYGNLP